MKGKKEIQEYLQELKESSHTSSNMNYERHGAISALEWVLESGKNKPAIGYRG